MATRILLLVFILYLIITLVIGRYWVFFRFGPKKKIQKDKKNLLEIEEISFTNENGLQLNGWFIRGLNNPTNKTLFVIPGWRRTRLRILQHIELLLMLDTMSLHMIKDHMAKVIPAC